MDLLEKKEYYINLFDFYESLFTEKQRRCFREYYFQDLSLGEIAEAYGVSRTAIYDRLRKIASQLDRFEEKLKLFHKYSERKKIYGELAEKHPETQELINKLKELE